MSNIISALIIDRTQEDVDRVRELKQKIRTGGVEALSPAEYAEYFAGMKGAYNATDLNRVGEASNYVCRLCANFGLRTKGYAKQKTDWTIADIPTYTQMENYLNSIKLLRDTISAAVQLISTYVPSTMNNFNYESANALESILIQAEEIVMGLEQHYFFSGELYSGEV